LRRCVYNGNKLLDLWKDGLLVGIGPGDYDLLCWMQEARPDRGLPIRSLVLAELTLNFVRLAIEIFRHAVPTPSQLQFVLRLENMTVDGHRCILSTGRDSRFPDISARTAEGPDANIESTYIAQFEAIDDGHVTFELLGGLYSMFGFDYSEMPYVDQQVNRITPESLLGHPA
jgi:hypothetical protein